MADSSGDGGRTSVADRIKALQIQSQNAAVPPTGPTGGTATSRKAGSGVAARIAAMKKQQQQQEAGAPAAADGGTSSSGDGGGVSERKKVSALAGNLAGQLNMNAMLGGGHPPPHALRKRPSKSAPSAGMAEEGTTSSATDSDSGGKEVGAKDGTIVHVARPIIGAGRRRRRGHRELPLTGKTSEERTAPEGES